MLAGHFCSPVHSFSDIQRTMRQFIFHRRGSAGVGPMLRWRSSRDATWDRERPMHTHILMFLRRWWDSRPVVTFEAVRSGVLAPGFHAGPSARSGGDFKEAFFLLVRSVVSGTHLLFRVVAPSQAQVLPGEAGGQVWVPHGHLGELPTQQGNYLAVDAGHSRLHHTPGKNAQPSTVCACGRKGFCFLQKYNVEQAKKVL